MSYIMKHHIKVIGPHPAMRSRFVQQELGEKRGNWITTIQEYDIEIKPSKLVKGQGLCKPVWESQDTLNDVKSYSRWEN